MNDILLKLRTDFPVMWLRFEDFLEESYPDQQVMLRLSLLSVEVQFALISGFLLSKKMSYHTKGLLKSDWNYFSKRFNPNKVVYINSKRGFVDQQEEAFRVIINIFATLNNLITSSPAPILAPVANS